MNDIMQISGSACVKLAFKLTNAQLIAEKKKFSNEEWVRFCEECRQHLLADA